jgi:hypothetical protein
MIKWFLLQEERVRGPFSTDEIKAQVAEGQIESSCLIWGRPQATWQNVSWWLKESGQMTITHQSEIVEQKWHYALNGDSKGPFTRIELVNEMKTLRNKGEILIWTKGMKSWVDLYEFHDLLDEIGLNRREHPRAPIEGAVIVRFNDKTYVGQLKTISPGGFGAIQLNSQLAIGQQITVDIKSDQLNTPITVKANVQYGSDNGYYGFKFLGINMEAKAIIMEYIRSSKNTQEKAA